MDAPGGSLAKCDGASEGALLCPLSRRVNVGSRRVPPRFSNAAIVTRVYGANSRPTAGSAMQVTLNSGYTVDVLPPNCSNSIYSPGNQTIQTINMPLSRLRLTPRRRNSQMSPQNTSPTSPGGTTPIQSPVPVKEPTNPSSHCYVRSISYSSMHALTCALRSSLQLSTHLQHCFRVGLGWGNSRAQSIGSKLSSSRTPYLSHVPTSRHYVPQEH